MTHAQLSPSASKRWIQCTPSGNISKSFPDLVVEEESTYAAQEGTYAHAIAEAELLFPGLTKGSVVDMYVDYVRKQSADKKLEVEKRVDLSDYVPECFGSADAVVYNNTSLEVIDLKYGKYKVKALANTQTMLYALGVYTALKKEGKADRIKEVTTTIVQPRINDPINSATYSVEKLLEFGERLKPIAIKAFNGEGEFNPDNEWCFFCPAKKVCEAYKEFAINEWSAKQEVNEEDLFSL